MSLRALTNQQVIVYNKIGYTKAAKPLYDTGTVYAARVERDQKRRLDPNGEVVNTQFTAYLPPEAVIESTSKIAFEGGSYRPFLIDREVGRYGQIHHIEVEATLWG